MRTKSIPVLKIGALIFTFSLSLLANADPNSITIGKYDLFKSQTMSDFLLQLQDDNESTGATVVLNETTKEDSPYWLLVVLLMIITFCLMILWVMIFFVKLSVKHGHFKFVLSVSFLPGILALLYSAIFSSSFTDRLDNEPESFLLSFIVGFACIWILYGLWLFGLRHFPNILKRR